MYAFAEHFGSTGEWEEAELGRWGTLRHWTGWRPEDRTNTQNSLALCEAVGEGGEGEARISIEWEKWRRTTPFLGWVENQHFWGVF